VFFVDSEKFLLFFFARSGLKPYFITEFIIFFAIFVTKSSLVTEEELFFNFLETWLLYYYSSFNLYVCIDTYMTKQSHRKRFSRKKFSQIMISNELKFQLDSLKQLVAFKLDANWKISYADVIRLMTKGFEERLLTFPVKSSINHPVKSRVILSSPVKKTKLTMNYKIKSSTIN